MPNQVSSDKISPLQFRINVAHAVTDSMKEGNFMPITNEYHHAAIVNSLVQQSEFCVGADNMRKMWEDFQEQDGDAPSRLDCECLLMLEAFDSWQHIADKEFVAWCESVDGWMDGDQAKFMKACFPDWR